MLLGTGTCNLAIMFYRRNKNLKFWWLMRFVGSRSLKQPFWDFQGWRDSIQLLVGSQSPLDSTARACLSHRDTRPWPQITALQNGVLLCSLVVFIAWRWEALANSMQTASQEVFCSIWERKKNMPKYPNILMMAIPNSIFSKKSLTHFDYDIWRGTSQFMYLHLFS